MVVEFVSLQGLCVKEIPAWNARIGNPVYPGQLTHTSDRRSILKKVRSIDVKGETWNVYFECVEDDI